ncbi:MAG: hypothetical protein ACAH83_17915 [Alphaproteobacteria bacterium]
MTRWQKINVACGISGLCLAVGYVLTTTLLPVYLLCAVIFLAPIWFIWTVLWRRKYPVPQKIFLVWATILPFIFILTSLHGSGPYDQYPSLVAGIGVILNVFFGNSFSPSMTRPIVKVFSDKVHSIITSTVVFINGVFFFLFPFLVDAWQAYMKQAHPDFVSFLHKVFG